MNAYNRLLSSGKSLDINKINSTWFEFKESRILRLGNDKTKGILEYIWDIYTKPEDREKIIYRNYPNFFAEFKDK
jgi:hypothetical protein